jgi:hypothetical protein
MKTLVIYRNHKGDNVCALVTHEDELDMSDSISREALEAALDTQSVLFIVEQPNSDEPDDFRPYVLDQFGEELAMQFVTI